MDSIENLLGKYSRKEPPEIQAIKKYIFEQFKASASITVQENAIVITVQSASLANALRFRTLQLQDACSTTKKIILRIG